MESVDDNDIVPKKENLTTAKSSGRKKATKSFSSCLQPNLKSEKASVTLPWLSVSKLSKKIKDSENQERNCLSCVFDEYEINRKDYYQRSFLVQKKSATDNFYRHYLKSS